jgi:hypothetical protein
MPFPTESGTLPLKGQLSSSAEYEGYDETTQFTLNSITSIKWASWWPIWVLLTTRNLIGTSYYHPWSGIKVNNGEVWNPHVLSYNNAKAEDADNKLTQKHYAVPYIMLMSPGSIGTDPFHVDDALFGAFSPFWLDLWDFIACKNSFANVPGLADLHRIYYRVWTGEDYTYPAHPSGSLTYQWWLLASWSNKYQKIFARS